MPKSVFATQISGPAFYQYIQAVVKQLNNNERVSIVESLASGIKFASAKSLEDATAMYDKEMASLKYPMRWSVFDEFHKKLFEKCCDTLQMNLNGENEITKPFLDR